MVDLIKKKKESEELIGLEWQIKDLLKNKNFWILTAVFSLQFSSMMAILAHITFYAAEKGWADQAAFIFAMYAIPAMISKVVFGWLVEKKIRSESCGFYLSGFASPWTYSHFIRSNTNTTGICNSNFWVWWRSRASNEQYLV